MKFSLKLITLLGLGLCIGSCLLTSCVDDDSEVGLNLQNPEDRAVVFNDSSTILHTYTYQQYDSIYLNPGNLLLGYNVDEKLGKFQNNFMLEVGISNYDISFGDNPVADSLILSLDYYYAYGDTTQEQTISIYELNKDLSLNDPSNSIHGRPMDESVVSEYYYSDDLPITTFSFTPRPSDTLPLKIPLPEEFRDRFLDTTYYSSLDSFQMNLFRGFYLVAEPIDNGGAICYFTTGDSTRMDLYLHNEEDTITYGYNINSYTYRCNIFNREYNPEIKYLGVDETTDTSMIQELFYMKFNNAFESRIDITGLQTWADSAFYFTINKAVLDIYTEQAEPDSFYFPLPPLEVLKIDDENQRLYLIEYITSTEYMQINHTELSDGYGYHINLNQTLIDAIENGNDKLSILLTTDRETNKSYANRIILKGPTNTEQPLKLKITYTKLNID